MTFRPVALAAMLAILVPVPTMPGPLRLPSTPKGVAVRPDAAPTPLEEIAQAYRVRCGAPGAVVGVRSSTGATDVAEAGELATGVELRPASQFFAGSVTKLFVAVLAYQLVASGELRLTDRVSSFLPNWPRGAQITIDMLLGHRSGMGDFANDFSDQLRDLVLTDLTRQFTYREVLDLVAAVPPVAEPGREYHYSNANYIVLGAIIQKVMHQSLGSAMQHRIFDKLKLRDTIYGPDDLRALRRVTFHGLYDVAGNGAPIDIGDLPREAAFTVDPAGSGIVSTVPDLLTFTHALYSTTQLLPQRLRDRLARTVSTVDSASLVLDAGFLIRGHGGESPGAQTVVADDTRTGTTVVAWCNRLDAGPQALLPSVLAVREAMLR